jgi:hypothetical protein
MMYPAAFALPLFNLMTDMSTLPAVTVPTLAQA